MRAVVICFLQAPSTYICAFRVACLLNEKQLLNCCMASPLSRGFDVRYV